MCESGNILWSFRGDGRRTGRIIVINTQTHTTHSYLLTKTSNGNAWLFPAHDEVCDACVVCVCTWGGKMVGGVLNECGGWGGSEEGEDGIGTYLHDAWP